MKFSRNLIFRIFPLVKKGFIHSVLGLSTSSACGAADGLLKLGLLWLELVECFSSTPDFLIVSAGFRSGEFPDQSETLTISSSYLIVLGTVRRWNRQPVPIPADDPAPLSTCRLSVLSERTQSLNFLEPGFLIFTSCNHKTYKQKLKSGCRRSSFNSGSFEELKSLVLLQVSLAEGVKPGEQRHSGVADSPDGLGGLLQDQTLWPLQRAERPAAGHNAVRRLVGRLRGHRQLLLRVKRFETTRPTTIQRQVLQDSSDFKRLHVPKNNSDYMWNPNKAFKRSVWRFASLCERQRETDTNIWSRVGSKNIYSVFVFIDAFQPGLHNTGQSWWPQQSLCV